MIKMNSTVNCNVLSTMFMTQIGYFSLKKKPFVFFTKKKKLYSSVYSVVKKSCIRETPTLPTNADSRTDTNWKRLRDLSKKNVAVVVAAAANKGQLSKKKKKKKTCTGCLEREICHKSILLIYLFACLTNPEFFMEASHSAGPYRLVSSPPMDSVI